MKAGRDLDTRIAKEVMGWLVFEGRYQVGPCYREPDSVAYAETEVPYFSTDIAAAWEVKNQFTELEESMRFVGELHSQVKRRLNNPRLHGDYVILHVTPVDICLAALHAKGVSVD